MVGDWDVGGDVTGLIVVGACVGEDEVGDAEFGELVVAILGAGVGRLLGLEVGLLESEGLLDGFRVGRNVGRELGAETFTITG